MVFVGKAAVFDLIHRNEEYKTRLLSLDQELVAARASANQAASQLQQVKAALSAVKQALREAEQRNLSAERLVECREEQLNCAQQQILAAVNSVRKYYPQASVDFAGSFPVLRPLAQCRAGERSAEDLARECEEVRAELQSSSQALRAAQASASLAASAFAGSMHAQPQGPPSALPATPIPVPQGEAQISTSAAAAAVSAASADYRAKVARLEEMLAECQAENRELTSLNKAANAELLSRAEALKQTISDTISKEQYTLERRALEDQIFQLKVVADKRDSEVRSLEQEKETLRGRVAVLEQQCEMATAKLREFQEDVARHGGAFSSTLRGLQDSSAGPERLGRPEHPAAVSSYMLASRATGAPRNESNPGLNAEAGGETDVAVLQHDNQALSECVKELMTRCDQLEAENADLSAKLREGEDRADTLASCQEGLRKAQETATQLSAQLLEQRRDLDRERERVRLAEEKLKAKEELPEPAPKPEVIDVDTQSDLTATNSVSMAKTALDEFLGDLRTDISSRAAEECIHGICVALGLTPEELTGYSTALPPTALSAEPPLAMSVGAATSAATGASSSAGARPPVTERALLSYLVSLKAEREARDLASKASEEKLQACSSEAAALRTENSDLSRKVAELTASLSEAKVQTARAEGEIAALRSIHNQVEQAGQAGERDAKELLACRKRLDDLSAELEQVEGRTVRALVAGLLSVVGDHAPRMESAHTPTGLFGSQLPPERGALPAQALDFLREAYAAKNKALEELRSDNQNLQAEIASLQTAQHEAQSLNSDLQATVARVKQERDKLHDSLALALQQQAEDAEAGSRVAAEAAEAKKQHESVLDELERVRSKLQEAERARDAATADAEARGRQAESSANELLIVRKRHAMEVDKLATQVAELKARQVELEARSRAEREEREQRELRELRELQERARAREQTRERTEHSEGESRDSRNPQVPTGAVRAGSVTPAPLTSPRDPQESHCSHYSRGSHPGSRPSSRPTSRPSSRPSSRPVSRPSSRPNSAPASPRGSEAASTIAALASAAAADKARILRLEEELSKANDMISRLRQAYKAAKASDASKDLSSIDERLRALSRVVQERDTLRTRLQQCQASVTACRADSETLQQQLTRLREENAGLRAETDKLVRDQNSVIMAALAEDKTEDEGLASTGGAAAQSANLTEYYRKQYRKYKDLCKKAYLIVEKLKKREAEHRAAIHRLEERLQELSTRRSVRSSSQGPSEEGRSSSIPGASRTQFQGLQGPPDLPQPKRGQWRAKSAAEETRDAVYEPLDVHRSSSRSSRASRTSHRSESRRSVY